MLIYSRVTMILGGMLLPIELFPTAWQPLLRALPFAGIVYGPSRLFVQPDAAFLADVVSKQAAAIVLFGIAVGFVYRAALRRIHANGG